MLLELGSCLNLELSSPYSIFLQMFIPKKGISFNFGDNQFEGPFFIILFEFEDPLNGLCQIKLVLWFKIAIKFWYLDFDIPRANPWMPSYSNSSILIIILFKKRWLGNVNGVHFKPPMVITSLPGPFYLFKLPCEISRLLLKFNDGLISHNLLAQEGCP